VNARFIALVFAAAFAAACGGPGSAGPGASGAADSLNRGLTAHTAGRLDEAVTAYFETLSKDPKNKFAFYNLGQIAQSQNRLPAAEAYYRLALEQDAGMASALFNLAIVRTSVGAPQDAIAPGDRRRSELRAGALQPGVAPAGRRRHRGRAAGARDRAASRSQARSADAVGDAAAPGEPDTDGTVRPSSDR